MLSFKVNLIENASTKLKKHFDKTNNKPSYNPKSKRNPIAPIKKKVNDKFGYYAAL